MTSLADDTASPVLKRIRSFSRPFAILLTVALGLIGLVQLPEIVAILFFFHGGAWHGSLSFSQAGIGVSIFDGAAHGQASGVALEGLSFGQRAILALLAALCGGAGAVALFHLRQLFVLYSHGVVFAEGNIHHIKRFGLWLAATAIVINRSGVIFTAVTGQPAHGTANAAMALVYGGMIYVIARVMEFGRQADEERKEFV